MTRYAGSAVAACWNNISIPHVREFTVTETGGRPTIDATAGGDTEKTQIDDLPNTVEFTARVLCYSDKSEAVLTGSSFKSNTSGSLDLFPEGASASNKQKIYCHATNMESRETGAAIGTAVGYTLNFKNRASASMTFNGTRG